METLVQTFEAVDDQGTTHTLLVYQPQVSAATRDNATATIPGMKRITTVDGLSVNRRAKGEYEIVQTGKILRSTASNAP